MTTLREEEFDNFLKRRIFAMNGLLIHGADEAAVNLLARRVVTALRGETIQVDNGAAKAAPGSFMDQMLSLSLLGDRQVLLVENADEACLKFLDPAFAQTNTANFIVVTANSLGKASKLRAAAEGAGLIASLALYEEDISAARERVREIISDQKLSWGLGAEDAFFDAVGNQRGIVTSEAEKLSIYALGEDTINSNDVVAICGDVADFDVDELVDAVLGGDLEAADRIYGALGKDQSSFFPLFTLHLNKLQAMRIDLDGGSGLEGALRNAKPPIFFKRKGAFASQLRALSLEDLVGIQETVQAAVLQSRKLGDLSEAIMGRSILAITRSCRAKLAA